MKMLLLISLTAMISNSGNKIKTKEAKTYYYYCNSHAKDHEKIVGKEFVLYTKVKKIKCDAQHFQKLAVEWGNKASQECRNSTGCTSDLNYYETLEMAELRFKESQKFYTDTSKYVVKVIKL